MRLSVDSGRARRRALKVQSLSHKKNIFFLNIFFELEKKSSRKKSHDELAEIPKDLWKLFLMPNLIAGWIYTYISGKTL